MNFESLDEKLTQFWVYRRLAGGTYAKLAGRWHSCSIFMTMNDGTYALKVGSSSFHEAACQATEGLVREHDSMAS